MMKIDVNFLTGQQLEACFNNHKIVSDQSISAGGNEQHPEPFDYFLASMPLCAAFYIRKFCEQREISTEGIKLTQNNSNIGEQHYKKHISIQVTLPDSFPDKYRKALLVAANTCTVKKVIQAMPEFSISIAEATN
jgi:putative redox protein